MESGEAEPKQLRVELPQIALVQIESDLSITSCTVRWPCFLALQSELYWPARIIFISCYWNEWLLQYRGLFAGFFWFCCGGCLFVLLCGGDDEGLLFWFLFFYKFQIIPWNKNPELKDEELRHEGV